MGWGNPFKKVKNLFSGGKSFLGDIGKGLEGFGNFLDVTQPGSIGDILTFGTISQNEMAKEAKKARNQAQSQYAEATEAARTEAERLANLEEERKRRILLQGNRLPPTLLGTYLGLTGKPDIFKPTLG